MANRAHEIPWVVYLTVFLCFLLIGQYSLVGKIDQPSTNQKITPVWSVFQLAREQIDTVVIARVYL